jgi:F-type H+-transporting ATPase subunit alpha
MAGVFDEIPEDRMEDAERAVRAVASKLPAALTGRISGGEKLTAEDRTVLVGLAVEAVKISADETKKTNAHG